MRGGSSSVGDAAWLAAAVSARGSLSANPVHSMARPPEEPHCAAKALWTKGVALRLDGISAEPLLLLGLLLAGTSICPYNFTAAARGAVAPLNEAYGIETLSGHGQQAQPLPE